MDIGSRESFSATEGEGDGKEALLSNNGGKRKKGGWDGMERTCATTNGFPPFPSLSLEYTACGKKEKVKKMLLFRNSFLYLEVKGFYSHFSRDIWCPLRPQKRAFFDDKSLRITSRSRFLFLVSTTTHIRTKGGWIFLFLGVIVFLLQAAILLSSSESHRNRRLRVAGVSGQIATTANNTYIARHVGRRLEYVISGEVFDRRFNIPSRLFFLGRIVTRKTVAFIITT